MNKFLRNVGFYLLIILVAISLIDYFSTKNTTKNEIEYSNFLQQVDEGQVSRVVIEQYSWHVAGRNGVHDGYAGCPEQ